jgi:hypothetical protein
MIMDSNRQMKLTRSLITNQEQKIVLSEKRQQEYVNDQLNIIKSQNKQMKDTLEKQSKVIGEQIREASKDQ